MAMTSRRILVTEDDMDRLRNLVRASRRAARRDQGHLAELDRELDRAEVVATEEVPADVVTMHSVVRVRDLDSGGTRHLEVEAVLYQPETAAA